MQSETRRLKRSLALKEVIKTRLAESIKNKDWSSIETKYHMPAIFLLVIASGEQENRVSNKVLYTTIFFMVLFFSKNRNLFTANVCGNVECLFRDLGFYLLV